MQFHCNASYQASLNEQAFLSPKPSRRQMVYLENVSVKTVKLHCPDGMELHGHYVTNSGVEECETTICLPPDSTAYLAISELNNRYYVVTRDNYRNCYYCTCQKANCAHIQAIEALNPPVPVEWRTAR